MKISEIAKILNARYAVDGGTDAEIKNACGSDMMSDVLAYVKDQVILLTGLNNPHVIRTCEMMDIVCVALVRGKEPNELLLSLAKERGITVLVTDYPMFPACGKLYAAGLGSSRS